MFIRSFMVAFGAEEEFKIREDSQIVFPQKRPFFGTPFHPSEIHQYLNIPQNRFFFELDRPSRDMVSIFLRSMTRDKAHPGQQGWAFFRLALRLAKTCQAQTNNELSTAKIDIFRGRRNVTGQSPLLPNVQRTFLRKN